MAFCVVTAYAAVFLHGAGYDDQELGMILALGITGVASAHVLTLVISVFFIALACLVLLRKTFRKNTLRLWIDTVLLSLVLNAYFLVPFADYYFNMETLISQNAVIRRADQPPLSTHEIITMNWLNDNVIGSIPDAARLKAEGAGAVAADGTEQGIE